MKAILVRSEINRSVLGGAIVINRDEVVPFMNPLRQSDFKNDNFKHYLETQYTTVTKENFKKAWAYDGQIFFQEVISNG
ncbi:hypothetical protein Silverhawkium_gp127 [Shigella phage Silverhawkium]|uniref:Uncharacterized protein n=1 Tax=Shigella phage Silverhawkium TaxID=2530185 RepID=A0A482JKD1_9CAUD|nr:hypothetical protein Silverhawkium_gp127 [Shigella phage Silverhawkium]